MQRYRKRILFSLVAAALAGCGGGSSGSPETTPPPEPIQLRSISTELVSGRVTSTANQPISDGEVILTFLTGAGDELIQLSAQSDSQGYYRVDIPAILAEQHQATKLVVVFNKLGFTSNEKVVDVGSTSARFTIDAILAPVAVTTVKRSELENLVVSANGTQSLRFSLVTNTQGEPRIQVGDVMAASDEEVKLSIDLPVANIPESVEAINSEVAYFDSSNMSDLQSFPGDFVGQGETENQGQGVSFNRDDNEEAYRLVSSTFSQIKLTNENQEPLPLTDILASSDSAPSMVMMVPRGSYPTIQKDFDLDTDGIQIPIYVYYSSRGWQYVGNGLLTTDYAGLVAATADDVNLDANGNITLDSENDIQLYVKVEITEANEWIQWINLDWPIKTGENIEMCFDGTVNYGSDENFSGYVLFNLPDGGSDWVYAEDGQFQYVANVLGSEGSVTNSENWGISLVNSKTGNRESIDVPANLEAGSCNELPTKVLFNPYSCDVTGHTYKSDGTTPVERVFVEIAHSRGIEYVRSDEQGMYSQKVLCDDDLTVSAFGQSKTASASVGEPAVVDFSLANQPPVLAALRRGSDEIKLDESVSFSWFVSDPDGDDVTVGVSCDDAQDCQIEESGNKVTVSFDSIGSKLVTISASDASASVEKSFPITVRDTDNFAPEIISFDFEGVSYSPGATIQVKEGAQADISALVRDRNGDTLISAWDGCLASAGLSCSVDSSKLGAQAISLSVTDDHSDSLTTIASINVNVVEDVAPTISMLSATPSAVGSNGNDNLSPITLFAEFSDDFTPHSELTFVWTLTNQDGQDFSDLLADANAAGIVLAKGELAVGEYDVELAVTDTADSPQTTVKSTTFVVQDNAPPSVRLNSDTLNVMIAAGATYDKPITFDTVISDDDGADGLVIEWAVKRDGEDVTNYLAVSDDKQGATIAANTLTAGAFVVSVTVTDKFNLESSFEVSVTITEDKAPVIQSFGVTPQSQNADEAGFNSESIELVAVGSDEVDQNVTYQWTFTPQVNAQIDEGVAQIAAGSLGVGSYQATVAVSDSRDQTTTQAVTFSVLEFNGNVGIVIE